MTAPVRTAAPAVFRSRAQHHARRRLRYNHLNEFHRLYHRIRADNPRSNPTWAWNTALTQLRGLYVAEYRGYYDSHLTHLKRQAKLTGGQP